MKRESKESLKAVHSPQQAWRGVRDSGGQLLGVGAMPSVRQLPSHQTSLLSHQCSVLQLANGPVVTFICSGIF